MGLTLITALELAGNYPEDIKIESAEQENGKYAMLCYMMRGGNIHKLMLSTDGVFDTSEDAEKYMHDIAQQCKDKYAKDETTENV